jgi:hypothetical protein
VLVAHVVLDETARVIVKEQGIPEMIRDYLLGKKAVESPKTAPEKKNGWEPISSSGGR